MAVPWTPRHAFGCLRLAFRCPIEISCRLALPFFSSTFFLASESDIWRMTQAASMLDSIRLLADPIPAISHMHKIIIKRRLCRPSRRNGRKGRSSHRAWTETKLKIN